MGRQMKNHISGSGLKTLHSSRAPCGAHAAHAAAAADKDEDEGLYMRELPADILMRGAYRCAGCQKRWLFQASQSSKPSDKDVFLSEQEKEIDEREGEEGKRRER